MDRKVVMQQDMQGVDPEFVLVFEVVGSVSNFVKAAKKCGYGVDVRKRLAG